MGTNREELEALITKCLAELFQASKEKYDAEKAEKTAALFLAAQLQLASFIADIELNAKHSKNEIARIEAEKYFETKNASTNKITEATLTNSVAKNSEVVSAKRSNSEAEAEIKKYNYVMNSLVNGHIFFRSVGKKSWND
jgi:hypothetical protein